MAGCAWLGAGLAVVVFWNRIASLALPDGSALVERLARRQPETRFVEADYSRAERRRFR